MSFRNYVGHVLEDKNLHVCGYDRNIIIFQNMSLKNISPKRKPLEEDKEGIYFKYKNKKYYVSKK